MRCAGGIAVLQWLEVTYHLSPVAPHNCFCETAAEYGNIDLFEWGRERGAACNLHRAIARAVTAETGSLAMLQHLYDMRTEAWTVEQQTDLLTEAGNRGKLDVCI